MMEFKDFWLGKDFETSYMPPTGELISKKTEET
jgi:hypothetical protein